MYKRINQPPFWLEVRKEYAVENFERLLSYLRGYQYITYEANGDFEKSVDCLHDAVEERHVTGLPLQQRIDQMG